MVLNPQPIENEGYREQTSSYASKSFNWKWEKRHWLLVIGVGCLALWWLGSKITEFSLIKPVINCLPLIGGLCFATDSIIKLVK